MRLKSCLFLFFAVSSLFFSQTRADGLNIPELFTTHYSTVFIPCYVDSGTDHENRSLLSWTRVGYDGSVQTMMAPNEVDFVPPSNVYSYPSKINNFDSLVVRNMVNSLSGTYTCHTDKGNASTLVHVLDGEIPTVVSSVESRRLTTSPCSENFDFVHGRCLYYSTEKMNWKDAHRACIDRTSSLITFKDVKDLMSFLLNLQKSGPNHYDFRMWTGYALFDESNSRLGALQNDIQASPMFSKYWASLTSCGYLYTIKHATIAARNKKECDTEMYNFLCEQPTS